MCVCVCVCVCACVCVCVCVCLNLFVVTTCTTVPIVEFVTPEVTVPEDVGDVDVCLRINGSISSPVTVQLFATPLTAEGKMI